MLGGSVAGLEYDEKGNIKGFNPEKFLAGFIAGGIASKATQAALKSPKLRQKALDFSQKAGEVISRTLKESNLPKHAQNALEIALGKRLANALDSRAWINEPKEAIKSLQKDTQELVTISNQKQTNKNSDIIPNKQATQDILAMEISTPKEAKNTHILRYELQKALKPIIAKPIINKKDGRVAILSKDGHKKIQSTKAISKSITNGFSEKQHFEVAKRLKELYENARLREIAPDKNADKNIQIPRYEVHFMLDGQPAQAKITLKETMKGKYKGNRIYTIELESIAKLPSEP